MFNSFIRQQYDNDYTHHVLRIDGKGQRIRYRGTEKSCRNFLKLVVKNNPLPLGTVTYTVVPKEYRQ